MQYGRSAANRDKKVFTKTIQCWSVFISLNKIDYIRSFGTNGILDVQLAIFTLVPFILNINL